MPNFMEDEAEFERRLADDEEPCDETCDEPKEGDDGDPYGPYDDCPGFGAGQ